jgi:hypothetical protein
MRAGRVTLSVRVRQHAGQFPVPVPSRNAPVCEPHGVRGRPARRPAPDAFGRGRFAGDDRSGGARPAPLHQVLRQPSDGHKFALGAHSALRVSVPAPVRAEQRGFARAQFHRAASRPALFII